MWRQRVRKFCAFVLLCWLPLYVLEDWLHSIGFTPGKWIMESWSNMSIQLPSWLFSHWIVFLAALLLYESEVKFKWIDKSFDWVSGFFKKKANASSFKIERDVWLLDAVYYVAEGRWQSPNMLAKECSDLEDPGFMVRVEPSHREILQKAYDGELPIWGIRADQNRGPYVEIDSSYWENHELEYWDIAKGNVEELETSPIGIAAGPIYKELKTSCYKVEELWSKRNTDLTYVRFEAKRDWSIRNALEWWAKPENRDLERDGMQFFDVLEQITLDGEITIWGRARAVHNPLEQIDPLYWRDYRFDTSRYIHLKNEEKIRDTSTHPKIQADVTRPQYYDLRLTSAEVKKVWPLSNSVRTRKEEKKTKVVERDVSPFRAIYYVATGNWDYEFPKDEYEEKVVKVMKDVNNAMADIRQKAFEGELPIWGKSTFLPTVFKKINPSFWDQNEINVETFYKGNSDSLRTQGSAFAGFPGYQNLMTNEAKVRELWPAEST